MDDEATRARRVYSINEMLIRLAGQRVRFECCAMAEAGISQDEINAALPSIVGFYDEWRESALREVIDAFDLRGTDADPDVVSLRTH